jgi:hypothetical protein
MSLINLYFEFKLIARVLHLYWSISAIRSHHFSLHFIINYQITIFLFKKLNLSTKFFLLIAYAGTQTPNKKTHQNRTLPSRQTHWQGCLLSRLLGPETKRKDQVCHKKNISSKHIIKAIGKDTFGNKCPLHY